MKIISIKLTDEEYKELEEKARQEGYVLLSEYIRSVLFGRQTPIQSQITIDVNNPEIVNQITTKLERKIMDYINPFTAQIDEIKRKIADLAEKIEELESSKKSIEKTEKSEEKKQIKVEAKKEQPQPKKTAIERLQEEGILFESELKALRDPTAFFNKLEREGAKIIYLESERIAMSQDFYNKFIGDISSIDTSDPEEAASKLEPKEAKLFRKLAKEALVIYDANSKGWKLAAQL